MAYMKSRIHEFITTFSWYRNVSLKLLEQLPQEALLEQISDRSCTVSIQFTDLGDTELKVVGDIVGKDLRALVTRPALTCTSKAEIAGYLAACRSDGDRPVSAHIGRLGSGRGAKHAVGSDHHNSHGHCTPSFVSGV